MAAADSVWATALEAATGLFVASTRKGLDDLETRDLEIPSVLLARDGGGDLTRFLDGPLMFADVFAADRATGEAMCKTVDDWFRWSLPTVHDGVSLRMRRCVSGFSEVGDSNTSGVVHYSATYDCVSR